jgi:uncharacterized repeat protein (TIGR03803 family)
MRQLGLWKTICIVFVFCAAAVAAAPAATTFTTLVSFDVTNGADPGLGSLVQGTDGNLYGTTAYGGANSSACYGNGCGTAFKISAAGTLTTVYSFCSQTNCADGANPSAGLVQATNGDFYGTTIRGGANDYGTVFEITPAGTLTTLYTFAGADGEYPCAGLVQATNGDFYGTTLGGGANDYGTVFEITPAGTFTTLHSFDGTDGEGPNGGLIQATNGNLYGTAGAGGTNGYGTVFKITLGGTLTTLYSFCSQTNCADGEYPDAGLVQATNGNFYGTTYYGGDISACSAYGCGTVFEITPAGKLTTLHSFDNNDGDRPSATLVQATNGNFYGTTTLGGANDVGGTVFEITSGGKLTTLYNFCSQTNCTDGAAPEAGLVQATNGNFYGTTYNGGTNGVGTVFSLSVGLGPFVETLPTSGKVGAKVIILGTNLTGATAVSFDGTAATFTVVSATEIKTTVPAGATTGTVTVTTPGGTLNSNIIFRVTPQITSFSPSSGPVGTQVTITGVSLTQTTKVTFGGVKATNFTVSSDTQVTAYVPTGAKTGHIGITTLGGTATSSGIFTVTQ